MPPRGHHVAAQRTQRRHPQVAPTRLSEILERLEPVARELVLVGGQAVHFWTSRYKERVPELRREWSRAYRQTAWLSV